MDILRGIIGIFFLLGIAWLFSSNRKKINWPLVGKGVGIQLLLAAIILFFPVVESGFDLVGKAFVKVTSFTGEGTKFLFESFISGTIESSLVNFVVMVLPTIVFFSALTSILYYLGILQFFVKILAVGMQKLLGISGAESMSAAGNIFLGQTEAPLLIKPYLDRMTKSEMMTLMTGGMATIAGSVLVAYIQFLGGDDIAQQTYFAKHLLIASVLSAPAAIVFAKMLVPEEEEFLKEFEVPKDKIGSNIIEAAVNGTSEGIKLAVNVAGMLLVFIALMAFANYLLHWLGFFFINDWIAAHTPYSSLSFEFLMGYICAPIVWVLGVDSEDMLAVGQLLGEKTILNEFVAYTTLKDMNAAGEISNTKSLTMATYMLCGFANFASIGIQVGGIGALAPKRKGLLSKLGVRALLGGTLACLLTAAVVGLFL